MARDFDPSDKWQDGKPPLTAAELQQCLATVGIMSAEDSTAFVEKLPRPARPADAKALAAELVKAGKLTRLQSAGLLQGKLKYLLFGEYLILDTIGQGGMGQVLKAEHRRMKRVVALKVMAAPAMKNPDSVRRFQREVQAAARLIHPNIVTAFDANESGGMHFLVMEYVDGRDLAVTQREQGMLPIERALDYTLQAARGLAFAHENGIVHRDIKPANLLVDKRGAVKILDMGLARLELDQPLPEAELTAEGQVMGTVDFMAPEQALDTRTADARADIYSLGCTLHRLLTNQPMYRGNTIVKRLLAHREAAIPRLKTYRDDVPAGLQAVFERMVAKQPEDRFQTMREVIAELERLVQPGPAPASGEIEDREEAPEGRDDDSKFASFLAGLGPLAKAGAPAAVARAQPRPAHVTHADETIDSAPAADDTSGNLARMLASAKIKPATAPESAQVARWQPTVWLYAQIAAFVLACVAVFAAAYFTLPAPGGGVRRPGAPSTSGTSSAPGGNERGAAATADPDHRAAMALNPFFDLGLALPSGQTDLVKPNRPLPAAGFKLVTIGGSYTTPLPANFAGEIFVPAIAPLTGLTEIRDTYGRLDWTERDVAGLAAARCARSISILDTPSLKLTRKNVAALQALDNLAELRGMIDDTDDDALTALSGLPPLKSLRLQANKSGVLGPKSAAAIAAHRVDTLIINHARMSPEVARALGGMPALKTLSLMTSTNVTNEVVAELARSPSLESLNLWYADISDDGLAPLAQLKTLRLLVVPAANVTAEGAQRLASELPACEIRWHGGTIKPAAP
ncbi:MAG: protein kinase [Planctomycetaceae bacterium]|nr:protein kinase [Planctomycetaceae bacterium]